MSKRFGRNQRRRAREALAVAKDEAASCRLAYNMAAALQQEALRRLRDIEDELAEAKRIAAPMSVMFPAEEILSDYNSVSEFARSGLPAISIRLAGRPAYSVSASDAAETMTLQKLPLDVLLARINYSDMERAAHISVRFRNGEVGYAISADGWRALPARERGLRMERAISRALTVLLMKQLKD
jgi:hypothetical protein